MNNFLAVCLAAILFSPVGARAGQEVLFYQISRDYGREGPQGMLFRREFEARMFKHANWHQRLFISLYEPAVDQTLEIYTKPDGSRWLSYTHATPPPSRLIEPVSPGEGYDSKKELKGVRITRSESELPPNLANELEVLWGTMLPGAPREPEKQSTHHVIYVHAPAFVALLRSNSTVQTGRIAMAAIDTPAYQGFVEIVEDLINLGKHRHSERILARLPSRIQNLQTLLRKNDT